ncbi:unnamed protein product, partial [Phaeothamnion confervicola]
GGGTGGGSDGGIGGNGGGGSGTDHGNGRSPAMPFAHRNPTQGDRQVQVRHTMERTGGFSDPHSCVLRDARDVMRHAQARKGRRPLLLRPPMLPGMPEAGAAAVAELLRTRRFLRWEFNVFELETLSQGHSLWFAAMAVCYHYNFVGALRLDAERLSALFCTLERSYCFDPDHPNPYHTHVHAADVTLTVAHFLETPVITPAVRLQQALALVLAAVMHDYRHPGVNNGYLVKRSHELAVMYNDESVLENFHAAQGFRLLLEPRHNALTGWKSEDVRSFRLTFVKCVLATDLAHSVAYASKFKQHCKERLPFDSPNAQIMLLQMLLKAADVAHPAKPWDVHCRWSQLITEEFFRQGDLERREGLPISPLCDRAEVNLPKSQCNFIEFVVRPCLAPLAEYCGSGGVLWTDYLNTNFRAWKVMQEQENPVLPWKLPPAPEDYDETAGGGGGGGGRSAAVG